MNATRIWTKAFMMLLTMAALAVGILFYVVYAKKDSSMTDGTFVFNGSQAKICVMNQEDDTDGPVRDTWCPLNGNRGYFV